MELSQGRRSEFLLRQPHCRVIKIIPDRRKRLEKQRRERNENVNLEEQLTAEQFYNNFVADDRFVKYILGGLKTTLLSYFICRCSLAFSWVPGGDRALHL